MAELPKAWKISEVEVEINIHTLYLIQLLLSFTHIYFTLNHIIYSVWHPILICPSDQERPKKAESRSIRSLCRIYILWSLWIRRFTVVEQCCSTAGRCQTAVGEGVMRRLVVELSKVCWCDFSLHWMHVGVSKNRRGPPKWMVKIMENPIFQWMIWGEGPPLFLGWHPCVFCLRRDCDQWSLPSPLRDMNENYGNLHDETPASGRRWADVGSPLWISAWTWSSQRNGFSRRKNVVTFHQGRVAVGVPNDCLFGGVYIPSLFVSSSTPLEDADIFVEQKSLGGFKQISSTSNFLWIFVFLGGSSPIWRYCKILINPLSDPFP